ncbi:MAG: tetratricopeptide repeat protein [Tolypothrix carrinoi HA7290-LM1]|jgi:tetratricopeptide (TPR) repeat protein|nr:tetratricopeptide repeat protein [Tolypothrix carrinoi HA7290-LM1]
MTENQKPENRNTHINQGNNFESVGRDVVTNYHFLNNLLNRRHIHFIQFLIVGVGLAFIYLGFAKLLINGHLNSKVIISLGSGCLILALFCSYYALFWNPNKLSVKVWVWRRLAAVGIVGIPFLTVVGVAFWMIDPTNTIVTLAKYTVNGEYPNQHLEQNASNSERLKQDIYFLSNNNLHFLKKEQFVEKPDVQIKQIEEAFKDSQREQARNEAKNWRATVAIWGDYSTYYKNKDEIFITSNIDLLKEQLLLFLPNYKNNKKGEIEIPDIKDAIRPSELNITVTQNKNEPEDFSKMQAYYINFIAGLAEYKSGLAHCVHKKDKIPEEAKKSLGKSQQYLKKANRYLEEANKWLNKIENESSLSNFPDKQQLVDFLKGVTEFSNGNASLYNEYCSKQPNSYDLAINSFTEAIKHVHKQLVTLDDRQNSYVPEYPYKLIPASYRQNSYVPEYPYKLIPASSDPEEILDLDFNDSDDNQKTCGHKRDKNIRVSDNNRSDSKILLSRIHHNRGIAYQMKGNIEKALEDYEQAIKYDPRTYAFCMSIKTAYANLNNYKSAINGSRLSVNVPNVEDSLAYYNKGNIYLRQREYKQAVGEYLQAIRLDLNFYEAYNNLKIAVSEASQKLYSSFTQAAGKSFEKMLEDLPNLLPRLFKGLIEEVIPSLVKALAIYSNLK